MGLIKFIESQDTIEKRLFWIVSTIVLGLSFCSTVVTLGENVNIWASLITAASCVAFFVIMCACIATKRHRDCYMAMCLVVNCFFFPVDFFLCGGLHSGMPMYMVLGIFLCAFCLERKRIFITTLISAMASILTIAVAMNRKDWVTLVSEEYAYRDALVTFAIVTVGIVVINVFVQRQYKNQRYKEINNGIIDILGTVVEFRSVEAGDHIKRIKGFTSILLSYVNQVYEDRHLTSADISIISSASAMHDVGKIAIPDGILLKGGPLTSAERMVMQRHTVKGCEIINSMREIQDQDYYRYGYEICRYHHERYDGGGYPDHLKGDDIPLAAQVVALADVYDALVNDRCYKKAFSFDKSFKMIMDGECGAFSPKLLKCLELAKEEMEIFNASMKQEVITITEESLV